jgi:type I restriction enzyme, S subunit
MLPSHWEQLRAKYLLREIDERSTKGIEELLSVSHLTGVTPRSQKNVTMFLAKSNIGHKICHPDDVVINTMWAWMGALGVARHSGLVSPSYGVYRPLRNCRMLPRYTDYLLRTPMYAAEYQRRSTGVNSSRLRLYPDQFLRVPVVLPPVDEQALIVKFLEHANRSFDSFIQAKRRQMTLLGELRQSVTEEALRSAGAKSLRVGVAAELVQRPVNRQRHLVYTPVGLFNRGRGIFHKPETKGAELGDSSFFWIEENDLVLSGQFAWERGFSSLSYSSWSAGGGKLCRALGVFQDPVGCFSAKRAFAGSCRSKSPVECAFFAQRKNTHSTSSSTATDHRPRITGG